MEGVLPGIGEVEGVKGVENLWRIVHGGRRRQGQTSV